MHLSSLRNLQTLFDDGEGEPHLPGKLDAQQVALQVELLEDQVGDRSQREARLPQSQRGGRSRGGRRVVRDCVIAAIVLPRESIPAGRSLKSLSYRSATLEPPGGSPSPTPGSGTDKGEFASEEFV